MTASAANLGTHSVAEVIEQWSSAFTPHVGGVRWEGANVLVDDDDVVIAVLWPADDPYTYGLWRLGAVDHTVEGQSLQQARLEAQRLVGGGR